MTIRVRTGTFINEVERYLGEVANGNTLEIQFNNGGIATLTPPKNDSNKTKTSFLDYPDGKR